MNLLDTELPSDESCNMADLQSRVEEPKSTTMDAPVIRGRKESRYLSADLKLPTRLALDPVRFWVNFRTNEHTLESVLLAVDPLDCRSGHQLSCWGVILGVHFLKICKKNHERVLRTEQQKL